MGLFTSKIAIGVIGGTVTLGGLGLLFTGTDTLQTATNNVKDFGNRLVQFEQNEGSLLEKIQALRTDANGKITTANASIADLEAQKVTLKDTITTLKAEKVELETQITDLKAQLATEKTNHQATQDKLNIKTAEYDAKVKELKAASKKIADLEATIRYIEQKGGEADKLVKQLEGELEKANKEVADHGKAVDDVKTETEAAKPLTEEEVDSVDTTLEEVTPATPEAPVAPVTPEEGK